MSGRTEPRIASRRRVVAVIPILLIGIATTGALLPARLIGFAAVVAAVIAIPGPSVMFAVGRALTIGRRGALLTVAGGAAGAYVQVAAVALGLGAILERSTHAYTALKLAGAAYLVYLGVKAIAHRRDSAPGPDLSAERVDAWKAVRDGFVVGATNPKLVVFLAAALPQFVDPGAGPLPVQMLLLGVAVPVIALVSDSLWAVVAGTARSWLAASPRRLELFGALGGVTTIGVGVALAASGRKD